MVRGEREDLHAGIPTCDYEYFALKIWESVGTESHVQNQNLSQCVKCNTKKRIIQCLGLSFIFLMIRIDALKLRCYCDLYIALIEQFPRYLHLGCYSEHQIS